MNLKNSYHAYYLFRILAIGHITATRIYWTNSSKLKQRLDHLFLDKYDIEDVIHNDMDAMIARMKYVQCREPSSWQPNDENSIIDNFNH